ncbi:MULTISPECIES: recombinase family protein [Sphingomonas]|uniref:recombinase family protein n=1 Tax=Sphingomonas TaxID=13687 RepID=UPI0009ECC42F|nr:MULTISPECIES: recombinase family protein [Sphingomonas]MBY0301280.1 recombinase family protein [Sphingomonas ginsenosidimutans]
MKTLVYARFSSLLQNSRSIEDQITICRERCEREGWEIVEVYTDYAISGAAGIGESQRPGLAAMLARIERGGVDQVLAESTDRIARHEGDSFAIRERLAFAGVRLFTLTDGEITHLTGTIKGLMDANFRKELGAKIKRGQRGTVAQGRSPAGLAYAYRMANRIDANGRAIRGLREIDTEKAQVVIRIFQDYADGRSPKQIAERLNAEGIPGPRGDRWRATTLRPDRTRGNGLLQNELYIGRIVHNRTSKVVEPMTRRVRIRPNSPDQWVIEDVPHLRIIDQDLWDRVQSGLRRREGGAPVKQRRARHMLSGLGVCGVCGGSWNVRTATYWGCGSRTEGSGCTNNRKISTESYERRVLTGLRERMLDPDLVELFVAEYREEYAKRVAKMRRERGAVERRLANATATIDRLVAAIGAGAGTFDQFRDALTKARTDREAAVAEMQEQDAEPVVALHPAIAADYRRQILRLQAALADPEANQEATTALRALIDRIVLTPNPDGRGVAIQVEGRLAGIVALATGREPPEALTAKVERVKGIEPSS